MSSPCKHEVALWECRNRISELAHALADVMEAACDGNLDDLQVRDEVKRIVLKAATPKPAVEGK